MSPRACSTAVRRFTGPEADQLSIVCRPQPVTSDVAAQAEAAYRDLTALLTAADVSVRDLTVETLHLRDVRRDVPAVLAARERVIGESGGRGRGLLPAVIQQPPLARDAAFELTASAVIPRHRDAWSVREVPAAPVCGCAGCAHSGARLVNLGEQTALWTTNIYGPGGDTFAQASTMFEAAEHLLDRCGMGFRDVIRTWIYLRDIDRDYAALNRARREFFQRHHIELRPASTGVQGGPLPDGHHVSLLLHAVQSTRPLDIAPISTPTLNEAWSYGAEFSRGLRVTDANAVTLHISGTASIDELGRTIHVGSLPGQVDRMLHNIETLLRRQGATFDDVLSGVVYVKRPADAPVLRAMCRERGFDGFPCALLEAPLCRPELLCEAEAVAMLPLSIAQA
jgi:enamine deaminase RidA (YjgF/YER057c/UK114 family)